MRTFFFCIALLFALNTQLKANDCYNVDFNLRYHTYKTSHVWTKSGKKIPTWNTFKLQELKLFTTIYVLDNDCVSLNTSYMQIEESLNGNTRGFTDLESTWTHCFYKTSKRTLSSQVVAIIPSGGQKCELRYGRFGGELGLLFSHILALYQREIFFDLSAGYRLYTGFPSDQVRSSLIIGSQLADWIYLEARSDLECGIYNGKSQLRTPLVRLNANYRLFKMQLRAVLNVYQNIYLGGGYEGNIWGRRVGTGGGFFAETWAIF